MMIAAGLSSIDMVAGQTGSIKGLIYKKIDSWVALNLYSRPNVCIVNVVTSNLKKIHNCILNIVPDQTDRIFIFIVYMLGFSVE